jgi:hypothetical protein
MHHLLSVRRRRGQPAGRLRDVRDFRAPGKQKHWRCAHRAMSLTECRSLVVVLAQQCLGIASGLDDTDFYCPKCLSPDDNKEFMCV